MLEDADRKRRYCLTFLLVLLVRFSYFFVRFSYFFACLTSLLVLLLRFTTASALSCFCFFNRFFNHFFNRFFRFYVHFLWRR